MMPLRVLVIDDNREVRRMVTASIKTLGEDIDVVDVPSAEEALVVSSSEPLDLVVIDIRLPGMSGFEVIARLRRRRPEAKLILVTGAEDEATRQQLTTSGADAFFYKPIEIADFLEAVKRCLNLTPPAAPATPPEAVAAGVDIASPPELSEMALATGKLAAPPTISPSPSLYERLSELKKQLKAVAALVVNDAGQVLEEAGRAGDIATGTPLLSALMHTFRASLQVSQSLARGTSESLQYFAAPRQCIYVAPIGMNYVLFVVTAGFFGPDKLGMLYHTIHLAVRDLQALLAAQPRELVNNSRDIPRQVIVDEETQAQVDGMFSQASQTGSKEQANGYWETPGESTSTEGAQEKDVLSYQQARELGLAPDPGEQP